MVSPTALCLVRHGETAWNAERRLQGHLDIPLNDQGEVQARVTAVALARHRFAAIYASDLARARQTAQAASQTLSLAVITDSRLRERHYGFFQGLTYDEAQARHPQAYARFVARDADFVFPGGGESLAGFAERIRCTLQEIAARHPGEQVLVVTHGGVLDIARRLATGKPFDTARDFAIPNAALNWLEIGGDRWRLVSWADQSHLHHTRDELSNA